MGYPAFFFKFRDSVFTDYRGLFKEGVSSEGDEDDPTTYEEKKAENFSKKWAWYDIISRQAENDPLKIKAMFELELKFLLNHLSYTMDKKQ